MSKSFARELVDSKPDDLMRAVNLARATYSLKIEAERDLVDKSKKKLEDKTAKGEDVTNLQDDLDNTKFDSELKIDGSISSAVSSPLAVAVALTRPAPDSPVTVIA